MLMSRKYYKKLGICIRAAKFQVSFFYYDRRIECPVFSENFTRGGGATEMTLVRKVGNYLTLGKG